MFRFKAPSEKTRRVMSDVASGKCNDIDFEEKCTKKISRLTGHDLVKLTSSGNNSIFIALSAVEGPVIIPDQGGWHGFKQIAKFLNKKIITLKTDEGVINTDYLGELTIPENSALIFTSFAGYCAEQDVKCIGKYCRDNNIVTIEDASAGIGDKQHRLGNGKYSDIIVASTGSPKIINVGNGGFITTNDENIFKKSILPQKLSKINQIIASGIYAELDNIEKKLELTINATKYLKKYIPNAIHKEKRGVNVIILDENSKQKSWKIKQELPIDSHGFITTCPNYNRIKQNAIAIEVKNLDYRCLTRENMDKIIEVFNNQQ